MRCPVRLQCRDHARAHLEYGLWGGESEAERAAAGYAVPAPIGGRTVAEAV
jgi:WhiB family redox-sensing transcriptional regulator